MAVSISKHRVNIHIHHEAHDKLELMSQYFNRTKSDVLEGLILDFYPTLEANPSFHKFLAMRKDPSAPPKLSTLIGSLRQEVDTSSPSPDLMKIIDVTRLEYSPQDTTRLEASPTDVLRFNWTHK